MPYGYDQGNPFGDPNKFTRSTGEDEINRYNEWMRSQPEWQKARGTGTGDFNDQQIQQLTQGLQARGITVPKDFHLDEGGNFNQKSRTKRNLLIAAAIGGGALTAGLASGVIGGAAGGASAVSGAAGAAAPLASTTIGSGFIPAIAGGTGLAGATGAAAGTAAATTGGSVLSQVLGKTKALSSVLGGAAKDQAASKHSAAQDQLDWERLNLAAPGSKLSTMLAAALTKNFTPRTLNWSGPGSGLRGEAPSYSGGSNDAMRRSLEDPMVQKLLEDVRAGKAGIPNPTAPGGPGHEGLLDKILGGAALGTSVAGALR